MGSVPMPGIATGDAAEVKLAALRALMRSAVCDQRGSLALDGHEQQFVSLLMQGAGAAELADRCGLSADEVVGALWRLAQ